MQIMLNGEAFLLETESTVISLIEKLDLLEENIAIAINHEIIPASQYTTHQLEDGLEVEIVRAVGGGEERSSYEKC